jgi:2C-methyl-D-erythritol 2,4-cyclodiphosphate synthase
MEMTDLKQKVHTLTNKMQIVLSCLELQEYEKCLVALKEAIADVTDLAVAVAVASTMRRRSGDKSAQDDRGRQ